MRSFLFVPGDSERKLAKVANSPADVLVLDLEDAVAEERKDYARKLVVEFLSQAAAQGRDRPVFVRVNGVESGHFDQDLSSLKKSIAMGILLPKVSSIGDISRADLALSALEKSDGNDGQQIALVAMVTETPQSILNMQQYVNVPQRTSGLAWSGEDLAAAIGASDNRDETGAYTPAFVMARSLCLMAAGAAQVPAIDAVFSDYKNLEGLKREALAAARDGFGGKLAIHPDQVEIINEAFTPNDTDVAAAKSLIAAFEADSAIGVIGHDDKMKDLPNLIMARNVLERAKLAGKL